MIDSRFSDCLEPDPALLVGRFFGRARRVLLLGPPGVGKTTLAAGLAAQISGEGRSVDCLGADPGSPAFGVPGAVCLAGWEGGGWSFRRLVALCSLDAARFRLPLVSAVRALAGTTGEATLLLDAPGVVRGVGGAELLTALVDEADIDLVLVLLREGRSPRLLHEIHSLNVELACIRAPSLARRAGKAQRARSRTGLWDEYLMRGGEQWFRLDRLQLLGTPPRQAADAWLGKQVAFVDRQGTRAMGEVTGMEAGRIRVRLPSAARPSGTLLVRDACRGAAGLVTTSKPFADAVVRYIPPADVLPEVALLEPAGGVRPLVHVGLVIATLVNGVFGDPLLHLRLRHQRRSLLFDLGEGSRLPARIAHQLTDVFITHAHVDHISGFLWLLRSRIGEHSVCRLYGPPGLAAHVEGLINGICWDRIGDRGPVFEVAELDGSRLLSYRLQAGMGARQLVGEAVVRDGILRREPGFLVRTTTLDHGTPVLAFSFEPSLQLNVRKERLRARGLEPGPWLTRLKQQVLQGAYSASLDLPDGRQESVARLAEALLLETPGSRLVYATDFADTPDNRERMQVLAEGAHTLFCESTFMAEAEDQARRTGHLTTRACGEIARRAGVQYLIPFHFSRRYQDDPGLLYEEIAAVCAQVVVPKRGSHRGQI